MSKKTAIICLTLSAFFWGTSFNVGKIVIEHLSPLAASAMRFTFASIIIIPILLMLESDIKETIRRNFGVYLMLGCVGVAGFNAFFFLGLKYTTPVNGALIMATNPLVTTLMAALILKEPIRLYQKMGMLFSLVGVMAVITNGSIALLLQLKIAFGDEVIMAGNICWAFYTVFGRRYLKQSKPLVTTTASMVVGSLILIILASRGTSFSQLLNQSWQVYIVLMYMAVFCSVLAYLCWNYGIEHLGAGKTSVFFNLVPVFTVLISIISGQSISVIQIAGGSLVIFGVLVSTNMIKLKSPLLIKERNQQ